MHYIKQKDLVHCGEAEHDHQEHSCVFMARNHLIFPLLLRNSFVCSAKITQTDPKQTWRFHMWSCIGNWRNSRGVFPPLETLAVKAVVAESGEYAIDRLVHSLQAHGALWQLGQVHHRKTGSLRTRWNRDRGEMGGGERQEGAGYSGAKGNHTSSDFMTSARST